jgi:5,10-methylenetetrahydrofolate reductase
MIPWSFEVYLPRRGDGVEVAVDHVRRVVSLTTSPPSPCIRPTFCSVTTRVGNWSSSADIAERVQGELGLDSVLHVCWAGESPEGRSAVLDRIASAGLWGVLALRGDAAPPSGGEEATGEDAAAGVSAHIAASATLVASATLGGPQTPYRPPRVFVAAHPGRWPRLSPLGERHGPADEAAWVARKVEAAGRHLGTAEHATASGASEAVGVITQVSDPSEVVEFVLALRALGCRSPVHVGVMVARDAAAARRVATMAGIEVPPGTDEGFARDGRSFGAQRAGDVAAEAWLRAKAAGVPLAGVHFFGMNDTELLSESVIKLFEKV